MKNNLDTNSLNSRFKTAVINRDWKTAESVLKDGADVNIIIDKSWFVNSQTALNRAVASENSKAVFMLLQYGADPGIADSKGIVPLYDSVRRKRKDIFDMLLDAGADPNQVLDIDTTVLFRAVTGGDIYFVNGLIKSGVSAKNEHDLLHRAALYGWLDITELLIKEGCNINTLDRKGNTPLSYAAAEGFTEIIECLIFNKADVNLRGKGKLGPLNKAILYNRMLPAEILLKAGADPNIKTDYNDSSVTSLVFAHMESSSAGMFNLLLRYKADPNIIHKGGDTIAHIVAADGNLDAIKKLYNAGADLGIKNDEGYTPLSILSTHFKQQYSEFIRYVDKQERTKRLNEEDSTHSHDIFPDFNI